MERQADSKQTREWSRRNIQKLHKCPSSRETAREVRLLRPTFWRERWLQVKVIGARTYTSCGCLKERAVNQISDVPAVLRLQRRHTLDLDQCHRIEQT
jgi:hypothetical protein